MYEELIMRATSIQYRQLLIVLVYALFAAILSGCGGGGGGGGNNSGSNAGSGSGSNSNWPGNIIGQRIEFTVVRDISSGIPPGQTVVYDFSSDGQVRGTNPVTGQVLTPTSYTYSHSSNNARIRLNYDFTSSGGGTGYEEYVLRGEGSILQGDYDYEAVVTQGTSSGGEASGRYRIIAASVSPIEIEGTAPLSGDSLQTLETLRFEENLKRFRLAGTWSRGYVALLNDGSISSFSPRERLPTQCNSPPCPTRLNPILQSPTGNGFIDIAVPSLLFGYALTDDGTLITWGGESGQQPKAAEFAGDGKVRALVQGSTPLHVLMEDGTVREPTCIPGLTDPGDCSTQATTPLPQHLSIIPEVTNIRYLYNRGLSSFAVDASGSAYHLTRTGSEYEAQNIPTGLPTISMINGADPLIIALSTTGQLIAWNSNNLSFVTLPEAAATGVVDFDLAQTGADPNRYHVAAVKNDGSAFLWSHDENLALISSTQVRERGAARAVRFEAQAFAAPGRFMFIR